MAFDASLYETIPQTNVAATLALVRSVITANRVNTLPAAKKALKRVRTTGENLRELHHAAPPAKSESMTRAADASMDRIWNAFEQRLAAFVEIGGDDGAEAERIHSLLFPNGMGFLKFKYAEQWAEGEAILGRITSERLDPALDKLVGVPFTKALRDRHAAYGQALGITKAKAVETQSVSLVEPLREARAALGTYMRVLVAAVDNGEFDESDAMLALAPILALRNSVRATKKKGGVPVETPPVSPEPMPSVD